MSQIQPADFATADYRSVLRRLTTLDAEAAGLRAEAERWHDERVTAADDAVREAEESMRDAHREVGEAQRAMEEIDARAAQLWLDYAHKVGTVADRYGRGLPPPVIPRQRDERGPGDYLDEVAKKVEYTPPARPITGGVKALFVVFGVIGGVTGAIANEMLRTAGSSRTGTWTDALPVVALLVLLACPVLAAVAAKRVADRRGAGLDPATVATVLITGLVTGGLLVTLMRV